MVSVPAKHVNRVSKTLADGTKRFYCYAWRGGPRINHPESGEPIDVDHPLFMQALAAAQKSVAAPTANGKTISGLISEFRMSTDMPKAESSRRDYERYLKQIDEEFGDMPMRDPEVRGEFMVWRDGMAATPRKADYAWTVLARVFSFAKNRGRIPNNPCERGGRVYTGGNRREIIWTEDLLKQLGPACSKEVWAVVMFGLWTGQRESDVLAMSWGSIDPSGRIRVKQFKTDARVLIPMGEPLAALVASLPKAATTILTNSRGQPWTPDGFRTSFHKARAKAGIKGVTFHDLRGTAVTRLALAGCSTPEIAAVTGHAIKDVDAILETHYLGGRFALAEQAISKLNAWKT